LDKIKAKVGHIPTNEEMWAASEDKNSVFHYVRQKETVLQLQLEWLGRVRQSIGREVIEKTEDGTMRRRVEPYCYSVSVNSGKHQLHTPEEAKHSPAVANAIILDRIQRVTYAQQSVLKQGEVLAEEINWGDQAIQKGLSQVEKLNKQLLQFKQAARISPEPTSRKRRRSAA
jgi:hypothetical protein